MKKQIDIEKKKRYRKLYKVQGLNKIVLDEKRENSHPVYKNFNFNKLRITGEKLRELSDDAKYKYLLKVLKKITELRKVKSSTLGTKIKRKAVVNNAGSKVFNQQMEKLHQEYNE